MTKAQCNKSGVDFNSFFPRWHTFWQPHSESVMSRRHIHRARHAMISLLTLNAALEAFPQSSRSLLSICSLFRLKCRVSTGNLYKWPKMITSSYQLYLCLIVLFNISIENNACLLSLWCTKQYRGYHFHLPGRENTVPAWVNGLKIFLNVFQRSLGNNNNNKKKDA